MATRVEKNMAGHVFNLQKQGGRVPPQVLASSRRILQNASGQGDVENVRRYLGIYKSGSSALGRVGKRIARIQGAAFSISQDIELLQSSSKDGRPTAVATARLINNLNDQVQQAIKSKWAQKAAEVAARLLNQDPVMAGRFLKAVGRGLRMGGLVVTAAMGVAEVAERFFENRRQSGAAIGARKDLARELNADPRVAQSEQTAASEEVSRAKSKLRGLLDSFGFSGSTENEATKKFDARKKQIEATRRLAGHLGVNVDEVLARAAARKGKLPSELTLRERNEALDAATKSRVPTLAEMRNSDMVSQQMKREFEHFSGRFGTAAKDLGSVFGFSQSGDQEKESRRGQLAREYLDRYIRTIEKQLANFEEVARQSREAWTPSQQRMHRDRLERSEADYNSHRSRHKAWSTS
jgi:hypothetical protein